jgi:hypothetical protein
MVVVEGRVELMGPMDPTAIDDHHDFFVSFAKGGHHLMSGKCRLRVRMRVVSTIKVLQKYTSPTSHSAFTLLSGRSLSDSNFPEAAFSPPYAVLL